MVKSGHVRNRSGRNTDIVIAKRRQALMEITNELYKNNEHVSRKKLLERLEQKGFKVDKMTLYNDRKFLAENNNFVRDIAETTYSQMIEDMFNEIQHIHDKAIELAEKEWRRQKMKVKTAGGENSQEREDELNEATPKNNFYNLALQCVKTKMDLLKGDVMSYSTAFLGKKLDQYKAQLDELQQKTGVKVNINGTI